MAPTRCNPSLQIFANGTWTSLTQKLSIAMKISNRVYVMGHGRVVFEGTPEELKSNGDIRAQWLEV